MKHSEIRPATVCQISGHGQARWLPLVGPPPCPMPEEERPAVLKCLLCGTIIERST